jgi:hypothetical protein
LKPLLYPQNGAMRLDGTLYLAPKVCTPEPLVNSIEPLDFLAPLDLVEEKAREEFQKTIDHSKCKSGRCQNALHPKCHCRCHYSGHSIARIKQGYSAITDFLGEDNEASPNPSVSIARLYS